MVIDNIILYFIVVYILDSEVIKYIYIIYNILMKEKRGRNVPY